MNRMTRAPIHGFLSPPPNAGPPAYTQPTLPGVPAGPMPVQTPQYTAAGGVRQQIADIMPPQPLPQPQIPPPAPTLNAPPGQSADAAPNMANHMVKQPALRANIAQMLSQVMGTQGK